MELVKDEWDNEIIADEPSDLLYVTYDPDVVTVEEMLETIEEQGFQGEPR